MDSISTFITSDIKVFLDYGVLGVLLMVIILWYMKDLKYYKSLVQLLVVLEKTNEVLREITSCFNVDKVERSELVKDLDKCMDNIKELNINIEKTLAKFNTK